MKWNSEADFEMSLSIIGNENPEDFFPYQGEAFPRAELCSRGLSLLLRAKRGRSVIETQGSKVRPLETLLSEMEKKSKGHFFISDVGWNFLLVYIEFL